MTKATAKGSWNWQGRRIADAAVALAEREPAVATATVRSTIYREDVQVVRTPGGWKIFTTPWNDQGGSRNGY